MKIRKLQLKNIGVFDDETIEFQPCPTKDKAEIHIFTGQNGTGKTTILMVLASIFECQPINIDEIGLFRSLQNTIDEDVLNKNPDKKEMLTFFQNYLSKLPIPNLKSENSIMANSELSKRVRDSANCSFNIIFDNNRILEKISANFDHILGQFLSIVESNILIEYGRFVKGSESIPKSQEFSFATFVYSSYRKTTDESVNGVFENSYWNPLNNSISFNREFEGFSFSQWIANNISKGALLNSKSKKLKSNKFFNAVKEVEQFIFEITNRKIEFELDIEPFALTLKLDGKNIGFDVLPDGLKSLISWIGDLLMRLDSLKWENNAPVFEREIILFLDEIEVHLHPAWQRKVLPVVQKLFKNSQIFVSTHSPFVVNSVDDAWVYKLELENGKAKAAEPIKSQDAWSYSHVLSEIFDIKEEFGVGVQKDLSKFKELRNKILASKNGSEKTQKELLSLAKSLAVQSEELQTIIQFELRQLSKRTGKNFAI
jgi:predicted ATP-binding protein involved in virulence